MSYIFEKHSVKSEEERLGMIEDIFDPESIQLLQKAGFSRKSSCLEIGPGRGSILRWMLLHRKNRKTCISAIDKSIHYLSGKEFNEAQVHEGDFQTFTPESPFELVHARYVLVHNPNFSRVLNRLGRILAKGGVLVLEEPDFTTARWIDPFYQTRCQRVNRAMNEMFLSKKLDPGLGVKMYDKLIKAGFHIIQCRQRVHLEKGGSPVAKMMAASAGALLPYYQSTGLAGKTDILTYIKAAHDPCSLAIYYTTHDYIAIRP